MQSREEKILQHVGMCIRMYRKKRKMTIIDLADRIYKSKATVSKYEQGQIAVDIVTLISIAEVLEVSLEDLTGFALEQNPKTGLLKQESTFFMYNLSPNNGALLISVIKVKCQDEGIQKVCSSVLYYDVPEAGRWQECDHIYRGTAELSEVITTFTFQNQIWKREHIHILLSTPLKEGKIYQGLILGLSSTSFLPTMGKIIVTRRPLGSVEEARELLEFSKEDLQYIRKNQGFSWKRNI